MNPFKTFIAAMKQRITDMVAGLPPDAQVDAATAPGVAVRACRRIASDLETALTEASARADAEITRITEETKLSVRAELAKDAAFLKEFKLITDADHNTAITAARASEKEEVKKEVDKTVGTMKVVAERRKQLVTDKVLTSAAAEALSDEVLAGDNYMTGVGIVKGRLEKLATLKGLAGDADTIKRVATMPVTAEGTTAFDESFAIWKKAAAPAGGPAAPFNPGGGGGEKPVVLF